MTPEEQAAADATAAAAAEAAKGKTPEQLAADAVAAEAAKKAAAGTQPELNADGTPKDVKDVKDGKPAAGGEGTTEEKAPETYSLKLGEGSLLGSADVAFIEKVARENNLSNESAQSLIDQQDTLIKAQSESWLADLKADKTYGGDKLETTQRLANAAVDKLWPKVADVGRATLEDSVVRGTVDGDDRKTKPLAERMYPNTPKY